MCIRDRYKRIQANNEINNKQHNNKHLPAVQEYVEIDQKNVKNVTWGRRDKETIQKHQNQNVRTIIQVLVIATLYVVTLFLVIIELPDYCNSLNFNSRWLMSETYNL